MHKESGFNIDQHEAARREGEFIGDELHDTVCQTLAGVSLMIGSVLNRQERGKEPAPEDLDRVRSNVDLAAEQLRLIFEASLLERHPRRLLPMLDRLVKATARRVPCELSADSDIEVSDGLAAYAFYRTARIFIHIAIRAGGAVRIGLQLTQEKKTPCLHLSFEGASVLSPSFATSDEKLLEEIMRLAGFHWRIDSGTRLVCGPPGAVC